MYVSVLESCKGWDGVNYDENPRQCAANARSTFVPYCHTREWWDQYSETPEAYTKWCNQWREYYLDIQDARNLYYRMMAAGGGWRIRKTHSLLRAALARSRDDQVDARKKLIAQGTDWRFLNELKKELKA